MEFDIPNSSLDSVLLLLLLFIEYLTVLFSLLLNPVWAASLRAATLQQGVKACTQKSFRLYILIDRFIFHPSS